MPRRGSLTAAPYLVVLFLLSTLLAGCGGDQPENESQSGNPAQKEGSPPETKMALGMVRVMKPETRKLVLKPSTEEQGEKVIPFKIKQNAKITLGGNEADMSGIERGQQAQIEYVAGDKVNQAIVVTLFEAGGQPSSGQPNGGGEGTN